MVTAVAVLAFGIATACGENADTGGPLPAGGKSGAAGTQGSGGAGAGGVAGSAGGRSGSGGTSTSGGAAGSGDGSASGGASGSSGSSGDGGSAGDAGEEDAGPGVEVRWAEPAPNTVLRGTARFRLVGRNFLNVEIKRDQVTIATCTVATDHRSAVADLDTTRLPNGSVTLTAHAWDSPPGTAFVYDDDAGPLAVTIDNPPGPTGIKQPFAVGSHWNEHAKYASMREAGVQMIRMDISWLDVQRTPGAFDWSRVDTAMAEAERQNIQVLAVLGYTNDWASSRNGGPGETHQYAPLESYDDEWGAYVQAVAARYGNRIAAYEIWNEPDHDNFLRLASGTWAYNRHPTASAVDKKRLQYKHLLDIALAQPALAGKTLTTSGFAEGGGYDTGFRAWLQGQSGFLNQFHVASFHTYGYPSYQRLIDVPASYRATQSAIGKSSWPFWITEHGINTTGVPSGTVKTYLIRSFATALAQGVEKLFWFRAGYDPGHMDLYDQAGNTTAAYAAFKTLTGFWVQPTSIVPWSSAGSARGSIATLSGGNRVAIVWNDGSGVSIQSLGLAVASAHDQDGNTIASSANLGGAPVFLRLSN